MSHPQQRVRFVDRPAPRAKPIPRAKWDQHKEELCSLYPKMTLEELMDYMKEQYGFEPSSRQYIYQFEKWNLHKYNVAGRDIPPTQNHPNSHPPQLSVSAPESSTSNRAVRPIVPPKRPKSMGSLQSRQSGRSSMERPAVPPKKRQKLDEYMNNRDPFGDPMPDVVAGPSSSRGTTLSPNSTSPIQQLATLGLQFASTGQPNHPSNSPFTVMGGSPHSILSSNYGASTNTVTPEMVEDDRDWMTINEQDDTDRLLPDGYTDLDMYEAGPTSDLSTRRRFDSSRPIHTFSQEELVDMKMAAQFLRSLGFDSDAFELNTILLKQLKEPNALPAWMKSSALVNCVRSSFWSQQVDIARNELFKILDEPRESSSDAEHFLYRMLLAETYTRSDDKDNEDFLSEIAIGCELASDKMLDRLPDHHRSYDILTYHYLNKCLEYLNTFVKDSWDEGTIFTDKDHLQIRVVERIPGPFELRHGSMGNPCLRSCVNWCMRQLQEPLTLPSAWHGLQSHNRNYVYWAEHIGLYCALWERWQSQRRDCFGETLDTWMSDTELRMGIHPAELLSVTCGMIMSAAPPRLQQRGNANLISRARSGVRTLCRLPDKNLACQFLDTYSLLGTLLGSAPQRQFHDVVSMVVTMINSSREREAFGDRARSFVRDFIERDLNMTLPEVPQDVEPLTRRDSNRLSLLLPDNARLGMESLTAFFPTLGSSIHSSELSAMRVLRDQIEQAARQSMDRTSASASNIGRLTSRSYASIPTMSELSQMAGSLSLSSTQQAANEFLDALTSNTRDLFELFTELEGDPFSERFGEVIG